MKLNSRGTPSSAAAKLPVSERSNLRHAGRPGRKLRRCRQEESSHSRCWIVADMSVVSYGFQTEKTKITVLERWSTDPRALCSGARGYRAGSRRGRGE
jgi:hypothetical protein